MRLTLTLIDKRQVMEDAYYSRPAKFEDYERVKAEDMVGNKAVIAAFLRGVADNIDPAVTS
ncbi:hypothetical protein [uncultured Nocardioides sp.]|jgi:hypothetical protein|uniref:hypothetical protein n=1 Tax=uncultured Nocardioides sp. TaxID=198441 RepID=UPI00261EBE57|nr:hypothetical protein [uncultured Nocardioides sp.]HRD59346.1 hypothetical protein [Nocardioides sp.]